MAFNIDTFKTRALTAAIFGVVMLTGMLWNQWSLLILFTIIHFGCWWEYFNLIEKIHNTSINPFIRQGFMLIGFGLVLFLAGPSYQIAGYALKYNLALPVSAAGFVMLVMGIFQKSAVHLKAMGASALGWIYISLSWGLMLYLYHHVWTLHLGEYSYEITERFLPILIVASIWINDTMAYIVGSLIGKTPLSPISPKKTWEGTIGGIVLSVLIMAFGSCFIVFGEFNLQFSLFMGLIALITSITGTMGDLLESKLKRMAGVKDSGNFMPGHGGFLDRFDSLLIATVFAAILVFLL